MSNVGTFVSDAASAVSLLVLLIGPLFIVERRRQKRK